MAPEPFELEGAATTVDELNSFWLRVACFAFTLGVGIGLGIAWVLL